MNAAVVVGIVLFVSFDLLFMWLLVRTIVRSTWNGIAARYPGKPAKEDAVRKNFQSFRIGLCNLGGCVHVEVDEEHLHMSPAKMIRWLGAKRMSVPWDAITFKKRSRLGGQIEVKIGTQTVQGPAWCLGLVAPEAPDETGKG